MADLCKTHAPATVNRFLSTISAILRQALLDDLVERNVCVGIRRLKENNIQQRFLTPEELGRLFTQMDLAPESARVPVGAIKLLLLTGARRREISFLRWANIDFHRKVAFIPTSKSGKSKYLQLNDEANCQRAMMPAFSSRRSASVAQYLETFTRAMVRLDSGIVGDCLMATSRSRPTSNCVDLPGKWVDASKTSNRISFGWRGLALIRMRLVFGITVIYTPLQIG